MHLYTMLVYDNKDIYFVYTLDVLYITKNIHGNLTSRNRISFWLHWPGTHNSHYISCNMLYDISDNFEGRRGHDRMVVEFAYAISAYHHWCCEFESRSGRSGQHYVIKFVRVLRQVGGFLWVLRFPPPIKLTATI